MKIIPDQKRPHNFQDFRKVIGNADRIVRTFQYEKIFHDIRKKNPHVIPVVTSKKYGSHRKQKERDKTGPKEKSFRKKRTVQKRKSGFERELKPIERFPKYHIKYDIKPATKSPEHKIPTGPVPYAGKTENDKQISIVVKFTHLTPA